MVKKFQNVVIFDITRAIFNGSSGFHQIDYIEASQNQVTLKLIPRIDYSRQRGPNRMNQDKEKRRLYKRPPQKLFDVDAIRCAKCSVFLHAKIVNVWSDSTKYV